MQPNQIAELMNEPACAHNKKQIQVWLRQTAARRNPRGMLLRRRA